MHRARPSRINERIMTDQEWQPRLCEYPTRRLAFIRVVVNNSRTNRSTIQSRVEGPCKRTSTRGRCKGVCRPRRQSQFLNRFARNVKIRLQVAHLVIPSKGSLKKAAI
ncbi:hypothetical protein L914_15169 [Phytophthora nicotianae]|uniref:Uncharacterized protein n=2 Tax=Phytophthora nicotianae TaxID=4792 RepID=V9EH21_PHYNI|nr:hypothetical protein F443_15768 [Phytophthora nicotianae P1569]ETM38563.1 hypothetical protein L914_15169 [Phytophthora nicotianae]